MYRIDGLRPSRLYHLEPMGIGTADVESITSYIKRLAQAHNVSTGIMLEKEILPEFKKSHLTMSYLNMGNQYLNGYSGVTKGLVDILENKTFNKDLKYLTLMPWEHHVNTFKLQKREHSWCPICYEEMRQNGQVIYDKLIWNIEGIEVCGRHKVRLEQRCPYCGKKFHLISSRSRVGYCYRCHAWLGLSSGASALIGDNWCNQINDNITKFLCESINNTDVKSQFNHNLQQVSGLFNSQRSFCSTFKITKNVFERWLSGNKPSLPSALQFSLYLEVPLNDILRTEIDLDNLRIS